MNMESVLILRIAKTVIGLFGIFGNGIVCFVIYRFEAMHTLTNALIFNQAVIDFVSCLFMLLHSNIPNPTSVPDGIAGKLYCQLWNAPVLMFALLVASTFSLIVLTLERYFAIIYPFKYIKLFNRRGNALLIIGVWLVAFAYKLNDMARYGMEDGQCFTKVVSWKTALGIIQFSVQYFLPLAVMLFAYIHIIIVLRRSEHQFARTTTLGTFTPNPESGAEIKTNSTTSNVENHQLDTLDTALRRAQKNTFKTLLTVYIAFLVCWTPNQFIFLFWNLGLRVDNSSVVYRLTVVMASSNSAVNFIIYALKYRQFRKGVRRLFGVRNEVHPMSTHFDDSVTQR
jgi:hypothetical protein